MTKTTAWGAVITAGSLALALSIGSPAIRAGAEERPVTVASDESAIPPENSATPVAETPVGPPAEEPATETPTADPPVPESTETPAVPAPAEPAAVPEADVPAPLIEESPTSTSAEEPAEISSTSGSSPYRSRSSGETVLDTSGLSALGIATTPAAPLQLQVQPQAAATPKVTAIPRSPAALDSVESVSSAAASNLSPLAVIVLVTSLSLIVLLGLSTLFYRTRIANRQQPRAFPRR